MTNPTRGVVIGASMAGLLAARVLARHVDEVLVLDRDALPVGAHDRRGVPQGRHAHLFWSGGARIIETLYPGITRELVAAGARELGVQSDLLSMTAYGWQHRFDATQFMVVGSRPLIDSVVRARAAAVPRVTILDDTEVSAILGEATAVVGVRVRNAEEQSDERDIAADIVVDASGRGSRTAARLVELGLLPAPKDVVDSGLVYATRRFRPPAQLADFPLVSVYADHRTGTPGRNGLVMPIEDGQWLVTLSGTRGDEPGRTDDEFLDFAKGLRHRLIGDLLAQATPLTPVQQSRSTKNRRIHYDRLPHWPRGLVCIGDAVAALNPVYGHGMSSAARTVRAMGNRLRRHGLGPEMFAGVQADVAAAQADPWMLAISQDLAYPGCRVQLVDPVGADAASRSEFVDLLGVAALRDAGVSAAYTAVASLTSPVTSLQEPGVVAALRSARLRPELLDPPLTMRERRALAASLAV